MGDGSVGAIKGGGEQSACLLSVSHAYDELLPDVPERPVALTIEQAAARAERLRITSAIRRLAADYGVRGWEESELTLLHLADELEVG
jgi:hypothetical protein